MGKICHNFLIKIEMNKIDINKALFELDKLVEDCPLSKQDRMNQKLNIQGLRQVVREWEEMKGNLKNNVGS